MLTAASFCGGGILVRHPKLKAAFLEGNCSWLPFFLWRLDEHWERIGDVHAPELTMAPSKPRHDLLSTSGSLSRLDFPGENPLS